MILTLKSLFVLFLFGVLIWMAPLDRTLRVALSASLPLVGLACMIRMILLGMSGLKLHLLLPRRSSELPAMKRLRELLGIYTIGRFFTNFIPTNVGGDVMKVREMSLVGYPLSDAARAVFLERLTGILAVYGLALFALLPGTGLLETFGLARWRSPLLLAGMLPIPILLYVGLMGLPSWLTSTLRHWLDRQTLLPEHLTSLEGRISRGTMSAIMAISLVYHLMRVPLLATIALAVGQPVPLWGLLGAIPIITFVSLLPISLGNLGLREGAVTFCLTALGLTTPEAFAVALVSRLIGSSVSLVGGVVYLLRPIPDESPEEDRPGPPGDRGNPTRG